MLEGFAFNYFNSEEKSRNPDWRVANNRQWARNANFVSELQEMAPRFQSKGIKPVLLKGIVLINDIYRELGARQLSDIDILINLNEYQNVKEVLESFDYSEQELNKWQGDDFKSIFIKEGPLGQIVIELHTRLFYHIKKEPDYTTIPFMTSPYLKLAIEENLIHLMGHLVFQHNFGKLFWLIDIDLYIKKYRDEINWEKLIVLSKELKLQKSILMTFTVLFEQFETPIPPQIVESLGLKKFYIWKNFLNWNLLTSSTQVSFGYYFIKHLTKDHISTALQYDLLWFRHKIKKTFFLK
ncbi:MAG: nucleotidyltransferase family protein [Halobacteriovoraceae bacterium]|nr:nucleotidyltransferase family protein [Halobacteriovoraceae bacterium]